MELKDELVNEKTVNYQALATLCGFDDRYAIVNGNFMGIPTGLGDYLIINGYSYALAIFDTVSK